MREFEEILARHRETIVAKYAAFLGRQAGAGTETARAGAERGIDLITGVVLAKVGLNDPTVTNALKKYAANEAEVERLTALALKALDIIGETFNEDASLSEAQKERLRRLLSQCSRYLSSAIRPSLRNANQVPTA